MKESKTKSKKLRNNLIGIVMIMFILSILIVPASVLMLIYLKDVKSYEPYKDKVIATATVTEVVTKRYQLPRYDLKYEYISEDGVKYEGIVKLGAYEKARAEQQIGKKVKIYIDGNGNSILTSDKPNEERYYAAISIFCLAGVFALFLSIVFLIAAVKQKKKSLLEAKQLQWIKDNSKIDITDKSDE